MYTQRVHAFVNILSLCLDILNNSSLAPSIFEYWHQLQYVVNKLLTEVKNDIYLCMQ